MLLSPNLSDLIDKTSTANDSLYPRKHPLVDSLSKGFVPRALKLLVAVSALLSPDDYRRIGPLLWEHSLSGIDSSTLTSVSPCSLLFRIDSQDSWCRHVL